MPRQARIDIPGALHHIICRGIERRRIFQDDKDRDDFVGRLGNILRETTTPCLAWALIPNHFHRKSGVRVNFSASDSDCYRSGFLPYPFKQALRVASNWSLPNSDSERHRLSGSKVAVGECRAQLGCTPCSCPCSPSGATWIEEEEGDHRAPQMTQRGLALQQRLEGGTQNHRLIDQMADLQALIVILRGLPIDPGIFVLQAVAEVFLRVETFVFDLPAQTPGGAEHGDGVGAHLEIGQVNEAAVGLLGAFEMLDRFEPLEPDGRDSRCR